MGRKAKQSGRLQPAYSHRLEVCFKSRQSPEHVGDYGGPMLQKPITVIALFVLLISPAFAQVSGRISGSVVDASGAQVPNAQIQLMVSGGNTAVLATTTNSEGFFVFAGVQPGKYDIVINAPGFSQAKAEVEVSPIRETAVPPIK